MQLRSKAAGMLLYGVVPVPCKPSNLQPYLQLLVTELTELGKGIQVFNAHSNSTVELRVFPLFSIQDYWGHRDMTGQHNDVHDAGLGMLIAVRTIAGYLVCSNWLNWQVIDPLLSNSGAQ